MRRAPSTETTRLWRFPEHDNLELISARFVRHSFPRHAHATYVVQIVEFGVDRFLCGARQYIAGPGAIVVINPETAHTGAPADESPLEYRAFYPSAALMRSMNTALNTDDTPSPPLFREPVIQDAALAAELLAAHQSLSQGAGTLERDSLMSDAFHRLIERHANRGGVSDASRASSAALRAVELHIRENEPRAISLRELSLVAGLSPFHLTRSFRDRYGVPPHAFQVCLRLERARSLLRSGAPIAQVAIDCGFSDQSHLTKQFRRHFGFTPNQAVRAEQFRTRHKLASAVN